MKFFTYIILIAGLCVPAFASAAEQITDFSATYTVHASADVEVTETIEYDFGADIPRHGIFRILKETAAQSSSAWYKQRYVAVDVRSVTRDGVPEPFTQTESGDERTLKIGDANKTIIGVHEYTIIYALKGALSYGEDGSELYWNATGNAWQVPIQKATIVLNDPDHIFLEERACYQGPIGSTESCTIAAYGEHTSFMASVLMPGSGLTIAQQLDAGMVSVVVLERVPLLLWLVPLLLLLIFGSIYALYRFFTAHKIDAPIIAQYEPYPDVLPMYTGVLLDGRLDPRDITAGLVYLAEQGFMHIRRVEGTTLLFFKNTDYEIELRRDPAQSTNRFAVMLATLLFAEPNVGAKVTLSSLKKNYSKQRQNYRLLSLLRKTLGEDLVRDGFMEKAAVLLRRRTTKGYEALNHLKGFKEFLSVTEKERYTFHNAPEKSPEQFMEYLPYAIAFGVEKEWADVFKDITIPMPDWYDGGTMTTFNAAVLTSELGSFSTAFATSSGTSGSSGGGSSGGGGGGGGGGSW